MKTIVWPVDNKVLERVASHFASSPEVNTQFTRMKLLVLALALVGTTLAMPVADKEEAQPVPLVITDYSSVADNVAPVLDSSSAETAQTLKTSAESTEDKAALADEKPENVPDVQVIPIKEDATVIESKKEEKSADLDKEDKKLLDESKEEKQEDKKEAAASEQKPVAVETPTDLKQEIVAPVEKPVAQKEETPKALQEKKIDIVEVAQKVAAIAEEPAPVPLIDTVKQTIDDEIVKPVEKAFDQTAETLEKEVAKVQPESASQLKTAESEEVKEAAASEVALKEKVAEGKSEDLSKLDEEKKEHATSEEKTGRVVREAEQSEEKSEQETQSKEEVKAEEKPEKQEKQEKSLDSSSQESEQKQDEKPQEESKEENKSLESESAEKEDKVEVAPVEKVAEKTEDKSIEEEKKNESSSNSSSSDSS
ncbi:hypothetical protein CBL_13628 [Carabus blaptoides fortunei]